MIVMFCIRLSTVSFICIRVYITYLGTSTFRVSFWLNWFLEMVSEASVTRGHGSNLRHSLFKVEYIVSGMRRVTTVFIFVDEKALM